MNKKFIYYFLAVIFVGILPMLISTIQSNVPQTEKTDKVATCGTDTYTCPDGTIIKRSLPTCKFISCPMMQEMASSSTKDELATSSVLLQSPTSTTSYTSPSENVTQKETPSTSKPTSKISSIISAVINTVTVPFKNNPLTIITYTDPTITPSSYTSTSSTNTYKPLPPENFAGEKFIVKDGNILTSDNKLVYNIPPTIIESVNTSHPGWTNTIINVVQVGTVAPVLPDNAIPIADLPGKYYLSQNSFGSIENCEFSNKIFILDTIANTATLMYEENNTTLTRDDPRACNSEIFLLTTEGNKLILKYHTIGTNTLCDSAWSEPEKTYYLDVTKLRTEGMKKYIIPENLSAGAEAEEEACRAGL